VRYRRLEELHRRIVFTKQNASKTSSCRVCVNAAVRMSRPAPEASDTTYGEAQKGWLEMESEKARNLFIRSYPCSHRCKYLNDFGTFHASVIAYQKDGIVSTGDGGGACAENRCLGDGVHQYAGIAQDRLASGHTSDDDVNDLLRMIEYQAPIHH